MSNNSSYLKPSESVDSQHPAVLKLATDLTEGRQDQHERARRLFLHVRDNIKYSLHSPFFLPEHYRASGTISRGSGYCVQKAVVLAALARASNIPSRLIFADIVNHLAPDAARNMLKSNIFVYHCYVDMFIGQDWIKVVPAFDRALCQDHGFPLVEFNGHQDALFPSRDRHGRRFIEYLHVHGSFIDVPIQELLAAWENAYSSELVASWKQAF